MRRDPRLVITMATTVVAIAGCGGNDDNGNDVAPVTTAQPVQLNVAAVATDKGTIAGTVVGATAKFIGVPYAAPPAGDLRWRPPQPRAAWAGTLATMAPGAKCPQLGAAGQTATEDCLFLNVTVPYPVTRAKMPVYVFIHGGGFSGGQGSDYDPTALVTAGNFVAVTLNYRLGIFGYLAHHSLDSGTVDIGNYGLMDQRAALTWVRNNIAAFGGDPANVTLGGESAGAMSTCNHLASPASQGLFKQAIVESGPCAFEWDTVEQKLRLEAAVPATLGCTGTDVAVAACLRSPSLSIASALATGATLQRGTLFPSVGGLDIPVQPRTALGKIPLLLGFNTLENGAGAASPADDASYTTALTAVYGATDTPAVRSVYPFASFASGNAALRAALSDFDPLPGAPQISVCNNMRTYELRQTAGMQPVFGYEFADPAPPPGQIPGTGPIHTTELVYVFPLATTPFSAGSKRLSDQMVAYWSNFVNKSDPNGTGLPTWAPYSGVSTVQKLLPDAVAPYNADAAHNCTFWKTLGYGL